MRYSFLVLGLLCAVLAGCATSVQRDAAGRPLLQRADPQTLEDSLRRVPGKLSLGEVAVMAREGRSAEEIVARMRATGTRFALDEDQRRMLREQGVPERVIAALIAAEKEAQRVDRLTAEADREAQSQRRARAYRNWSRAYPYYDPWWGWHPYLGYSRFRRFHGWHGGIGWGW